MKHRREMQIKYLRLSQEDGDVAEGISAESVSIASQRACIGQYLRTHPDLEGEFEEIVDDGFSGTHFERPGVKRLLRLCELGYVKTIVVRDLSRFARNYLEAGHYLEYVFPSCGVRFIAINDGYDSKDLPDGAVGLHIAIRNLVNQLYSRDISRKIKSAVDLKKLNGEYAYGAVPYGYRKGEAKNTIVIDEAAAQVVRRIFQMACEGHTVTQIAKALNAEGVTTPSVYLAPVRGKYKTREFWTYDSIRNILTNRIYTGDTVPFKSHVVKIGSDKVKAVPESEQLVIPETHEAIVSRETFYAARTVIKSNVKSPSKGMTSILNSYLICGCCGNRLTKGKAQNKAFLCASARYNPDSGCKDVRAEEEILKGILLRAIKQQCLMVDSQLKMVRSAMRSARSEIDTVEMDLRLQRKELDGRRAEKMRLYESYVSGSLQKDRYLEKKKNLDEREQSVRLSITLLEERKADLLESAKKFDIESGSQFLDRYMSTAELDSGIVSELVEKIIVFPNNSIKIMWNFRDITPNFGTETSVLTSEIL